MHVCYLVHLSRVGDLSIVGQGHTSLVVDIHYLRVRPNLLKGLNQGSVSSRLLLPHVVRERAHEIASARTGLPDLRCKVAHRIRKGGHRRIHSTHAGGMLPCDPGHVRLVLLQLRAHPAEHVILRLRHLLVRRQSRLKDLLAQLLHHGAPLLL